MGHRHKHADKQARGATTAAGLLRAADSSPSVARPAAAVTSGDSRPWGLTSYLDSGGVYVDESAVIGTSDVWACIRLVASTIAGRTWSEWRGPTRLERPSRLVRRPMASITRRAWTARVVATLMLYHRCYLWMVGGVDTEGVPGSLLPVPPTAIVPEGIVDPYGLVPPAAYRIGGARVSAEELIILELVPMPTPDAWLGSAINRARAMYGSALASSNYARSWWADAGAPSVVISTDQELTDAQGDALRDKWVARRAGGSRVPAVLGKGAKAFPFGADPTTEAAVEARREITAEVARYFGIPPYLVNAPLAGGLARSRTRPRSHKRSTSSGIAYAATPIRSRTRYPTSCRGIISRAGVPRSITTS